MRLLFGPKQLEDTDQHGKDNVLADYGIQNLSTLHLVIRLLGGTEHAIHPVLTAEEEKAYDVVRDIGIKFTNKADAILGGVEGGTQI